LHGKLIEYWGQKDRIIKMLDAAPEILRQVNIHTKSDAGYNQWN